MEILAFDPDVDVTIKYAADCPHCGDHSFPITIKGTVKMKATTKTLYTGHRMVQGSDVIYLTTEKR